MTADLKYNDLVGVLDQQFPHFPAYLGDLRESIGDNAALYFTFFSVYLKEHWTDSGIHLQLADLLQNMQASPDEATQITLHDFLLDVCSSCKEHDKDINLLMQHLTPPLQMELQQINKGWQAAACELPRGCC